jgi:hypothetical protein
MTHPHDRFIEDTLDRIHAQRTDQPPDHAKDAHGELVYDQRCRRCRSVTVDPLPAWLAADLDLLATQKEARDGR